MSEIEVPDRPRSLNRRLAPSSSRERICRPAERVARAACLGSPDGSSAETTDLGAILPSRSLFVCYTNKNVNEAARGAGWPGREPAKPGSQLASGLKILINRASVDPGRELNGRSQQSPLLGVIDVAGP